MEGVGESALDVLSRAATMLQEQSPIHIANDEPKLTSKQLPSTKWKRDRRTKPEYSRKCDPPKPTDGRESPTSRLDQQDPSSANGNIPTSSETTTTDDSPLDMSVRHRGLPPSYSQAISDPSFRSSYKSPPTPGQSELKSGEGTAAPSSKGNASVCNGSGSGRDELPSGISMCDPIIDEHFRRSLGKAYMTVFNNNNNQPQNTNKETSNCNSRTSPIPNNVPTSSSSSSVPVKTPQTQAKSSSENKSNQRNPVDSAVNSVDNHGDSDSKRVTIVNTSTVSDLMDGGGMSVDDHFAKALGDTWLKLNGKKEENGSLKTANGVVENGNANNLVTI